MKTDPITIHLGGQTRTLKVTPKALRIAKRLLEGADVRRELALKALDMDTICCCAAAALVHEQGDKSDPGKVEKWIEREPAVFPELSAKTLEAYRRAWVALGILEDDDEEQPPTGGDEAPGQ